MKKFLIVLSLFIPQATMLGQIMDNGVLLAEPMQECCPQPRPDCCGPRKYLRKVCRPRICCPTPIFRCKSICRPKTRCILPPAPCRPKPVCCPIIRCCRPKPKCCPQLPPECPPPACIEGAIIENPPSPCALNPVGNATIPALGTFPALAEPGPTLARGTTYADVDLSQTPEE